MGEHRYTQTTWTGKTALAYEAGAWAVKLKLATVLVGHQRVH